MDAEVLKVKLRFQFNTGQEGMKGAGQTILYILN